MPNKISLDKRVLLNLYREKELSMGKISKKLGYSQTCVRNNLLRHDIPIVTNSERYTGKPGHPHTAESRKKLSLAKRGDKNPMKRPEVKMKVSKANKGRKHSEQARRNMNKAMKGRVVTWGESISKVKKRWYASEQGLKFIEKLQKRKGCNNPMFNKSAEIRKRHWTKHWDQNQKEQIIERFRKSRMKQKFPVKATAIEQIIEAELKKRNIRFIAHQSMFGVCQPDIVIPSHKIVIQCDGDWWHANPKIYSRDKLTKIQQNNIRRDRYQDAIFNGSGWRVIRLWGSEIKENGSACVDRIEKAMHC